MYARDTKLIAEYALESADNFSNVVLFVLTTIQQPLSQCGAAMNDVDQHGADSKRLFGSKRDGYAYLQEHKESLWLAACDAIEAGCPVALIDRLSDMPGLGIVKAAFVAQCIGLPAACLDTHNLKRLGLPETAFRLSKKVKPATKLRKIRDYLDACAKHAESSDWPAYWWNTWCEHVAGNRANRALATGDIVSAYHALCILRKV